MFLNIFLNIINKYVVSKSNSQPFEASLNCKVTVHFLMKTKLNLKPENENQTELEAFVHVWKYKTPLKIAK